ncbi:hypothetical protein, partial [Staphylococcus aureus]|uniref:hypothetical protein n=1 Tax=Staphylococcus aureus TaxID=1280 RepID=UPI00301D0BBB
MNVLLVSDNLTMECVSIDLEKIANVTKFNSNLLFFLKFDFLFVESAWQGYKNRWKYKIASYPDVPKRNNHAL